MNVTISRARKKFMHTLYFAWAAAGGLLFVDSSILKWSLIFVFFSCSIRLMVISCEKCGTPVYLGDSRVFGLPEIRLFPAKKCPKCGILRS